MKYRVINIIENSLHYKLHKDQRQEKDIKFNVGYLLVDLLSYHK